jgi:hypothetical protein
MMWPQYYVAVVCCASVGVVIVDASFIYPGRWKGYYVPYTHWAFALQFVYFLLRTYGYGYNAPMIKSLRLLALASALAVNTGYWLLLYPRAKRKGVYKNFLDLNPLSVCKHGGSVLWLCGDAIMSGFTFAPLDQTAMVMLVFFNILYLMHSVAHRRSTGFQVYGDFFRKPQTRVAFVVGPVFSYTVAWLVWHYISAAVSHVGVIQVMRWENTPFPFCFLLPSALHIFVVKRQSLQNRIANAWEIKIINKRVGVNS